MGVPAAPKKVQLFCGVLFNGGADLDSLPGELQNLFGPIESTSAVFDFTYTGYYENEMGAGLRKIFYVFDELIDAERIADIKIETNKLEEKYIGAGGGRRANLDPGYLDLSKLVLPTTKDRGHRIYLGRGIFAEVTLVFERKTFTPLPWTYADFKSETYIEYFNVLRKRYLEITRAGAG
jgi:hypothetical protein